MIINTFDTHSTKPHAYVINQHRKKEAKKKFFIYERRIFVPLLLSYCGMPLIFQNLIT